MKYLRHALRQTTSHLLKLIGASFSASLALIALYFWKGHELAMEEIPFAVTALSGPIIGAVLYFLWNLICSPYQILKSERDQLVVRVAELENGRSSVRDRVDFQLTQDRIDAAKFLRQTSFPHPLALERDPLKSRSIQARYDDALSAFVGNLNFRAAAYKLMELLEKYWYLIHANESNFSQQKRMNIANNLYDNDIQYLHQICAQWLLGEISDEDISRCTDQLCEHSTWMKYEFGDRSVSLIDKGSEAKISLTILSEPDSIFDPFDPKNDQ